MSGRRCGVGIVSNDSTCVVSDMNMSVYARRNELTCDEPGCNRIAMRDTTHTFLQIVYEQHTELWKC